MTTNVTTGNLGINVLGHEEYDTIQNKLSSELYIVKEDNSDTDNAISSRTYADVGRDAVYYGSSTPTSSNTKIWIDTSEDPILIAPASINMDNLSNTGMENLQGLLAPNFNQITYYSQTAGQSFTLPKTGWLYIIYGASSSIELKKDNSSGLDLVGCVCSADNKGSNHLLLKKDTVVYVNRRSGTVTIAFIPCMGSV